MRMKETNRITHNLKELLGCCRNVADTERILPCLVSAIAPFFGGWGFTAEQALVPLPPDNKGMSLELLVLLSAFKWKSGRIELYLHPF